MRLDSIRLLRGEMEKINAEFHVKVAMKALLPSVTQLDFNPGLRVLDYRGKAGDERGR